MSSFSTMKRASLTFFLLIAATSVRANPSPLTERRLGSLGTAIKDAATAKHEENDFMSESRMVQLHVITRHGARSMLSKDPDTLAEEGGATLTPLGHQQLYDLGVWLRENYKDLLAGGNSLNYYNPSLHRFESSNLDRTLTSANALAQGLFPSKTRATGIHNTDPLNTEYDVTMLFDSPLTYAPAIPVYTVGNDRNDVTLRTYKNCPAFTERLTQTLYKTEKWKSLEKLHSGLLRKLGNIFPELAINGSIPLQNIWNVYDPIHVARTECLSGASCSAFVTHEHLATALSSDEFERLQDITEHVEHMKFGYGADAANTNEVVTAGNLVGSNLLWKILNRAKGDGNFFLYSAHAPTLLGFLSTLQATEDWYAASGGEQFVDYGAAIMVEIHKSVSKEKYFFVVRYKSSKSDTASSVVLKESATGVKCGEGLEHLSTIPKASWCSLDEVIVWAKANTLTNEKDWCTACNNKFADVCVTGTPTIDHFSTSSKPKTEATAWMTSTELMGYTESDQATLVIAGLFFGGFAAGALLMGLMWCFGSACCRKAPVAKTLEPSTEPSISVVDNEAIYASNFDVNEATAEKLNHKEIC